MKFAQFVVLGAIASLAVASVAQNKDEKANFKTKFGVIREDCYDRFLSLDISDVDCIKFSFSKCLGFAIVAGACILKVPQISKILANKSVDGLSAISFYAEFINLIGLLGNSIRLKLAFSVYGEAVFINL